MGRGGGGGAASMRNSWKDWPTQDRQSSLMSFTLSLSFCEVYNLFVYFVFPLK